MRKGKVKTKERDREKNMPLTTSSSAQQLRPLTLAGPEREPVQFTVNLVGAPAEVEQLVQQIKTVAEQFLYHWKTFPIG